MKTKSKTNALNKKILVALVITLTGTMHILRGQTPQFEMCEIVATYNQHCTGQPVTVGPCFSPTSTPAPCPVPLLTIYEGESVTFDVGVCTEIGTCSPLVGIWWVFTGPITITTPQQPVATWTQQFNVAGTYNVVAWEECGTPPNTVTGPIIITEQIVVLPVSAFQPTFTGNQNNCPEPFGGPSYYSVVFPPQMTPIAEDWYLYGMDNVINPIAVNLLPPLPFGIDWSQYTFTNSNPSVAQICVQYTTEDCGSGEICIPIYQCCGCSGGIGREESPSCVELNNVSSQWVLTDPNSPLISPVNFVSGNVVATNFRIIINGTFNVDVPIEFQDCPFIELAPEARIFIKNSSYLTLSSPLVTHNNYASPLPTHLKAAQCENIMWDGIYFEDGTDRLYINPNGITNSVTIRDARNAIVSDYGAPFDIHWAEFLNNNKDIVVNTFIGSGSHPGSIDNTLFNTASIYPMRRYYTPSTINLNPPLQRTHIGIEIKNVDDITIGPPGQPSSKNTFSNMDLGIVSYRSVMHSRNNWFNNIHRITTCSNPLTSPCPPEGICIYASLLPSTPQVTNFPTVDVGGSTNDANVFNDVDDGVYIETQHNVSVGYNTFTNLKRGVYVTKSLHSTMDISNNTVDQFSTGVWAVNNPFCDVSIHDNIFNGVYPNIQAATAIRAEEPVFTFGNPVLFHIHDNTIFRVRTGILTTNLYAAEINNANDIAFETNHPTGWTGSYGIRVQNNYKSLVHDNIVHRCTLSPYNFSNTTPDVPCFPGTPNPDYINTITNSSNLIGISIEKSSYTDVFNNITGYLGTGIRNFSSYIPNTYHCNTMAYCQWMLWLDDSNPGTQGSANTSQGNEWRSNNYPSLSADVRRSGGTPSGQIWYFNPTTPQYVPALQVPLPEAIFNSPFPTALNANLLCSYPAIIGNDPGGIQKQLAELLEWTQDVNCTMTEEAKFLAQVEIYRQLIRDNSLMNLGSTYDGYLQDFYNDNATTNVGIMANIRNDIDAKDYEGAKDANSTITPDNLADANEKATNNIYLDTWAKNIYTLTQQQYASLSDIAIQNPTSGGPAVYTARVMLGVDYDDYGAAEARLLKEKISQESFMQIYPNPASNELNIEYSLGECGKGIFVLSDLTGREVLMKDLNSAIDKILVSTKSLEQGVYFAQIKVNDEVIKSEKLLIVE